MTRFLSVFVLFVSTIFLYPAAWGQDIKMRRNAPSDEFRQRTLGYFNDAKYHDALISLNHNLREAVKIPDVNGRTFLWLDSFCYWTLIGECHYQMARYDDALRAYNTALHIFFDQPEWLKRITATGIPIMAPRQPVAWGTSDRKGGVGNFRQCKYQMVWEKITLETVGLMQSQTMTTIHADQIAAYMALMIRRRAEILGPISKFDSDTKYLAEILAARPCLPNHFTGTWVDVLYGLTLSAMGDDAGAESSLNRGLLMLDAFDHQLTPVALNELGNIAVRGGKYDDAIKQYLEASIAAFHMGDPVLLSETFRNMSNTQKLISKTRMFPPLENALQYFSEQKYVSPVVMVSLLHETAEDFLIIRKGREAFKRCLDADKIMKSRPLAETMYGARNHYLAACIAFASAYTGAANGKKASVPIQEGNEHLNAALAILRRGSLRLYHLDKLESFFQAGQITSKGPITERVADEMYDAMLREPSEIDWALRPMDCFAALIFTPPTAYERWFAVAVQRGDRERAFNISELARQARFYAALPLGEPRMMGFRLLFESDDDTLQQDLLVQRQTMALEFKEFSKLSDKVREIKKELVSIPVVPQDPNQANLQKRLLAELEQNSQAQEALLLPISFSRTRAPGIFPPIMPLEQIRKGLPDKTAMLVFFESLGNLYGFLIDNKSLTMWQVVQETKSDPLHKLITDYLQSLGNKNANQSLTVKELNDPKAKWKEAGAKLLKRLLGGESRQANFNELVIVPAGTLWYVPFESMSVRVGDHDRPLITAGKEPLVVRYAPMASLGVPTKTGRSLTGETLVVHGKMMMKDSPDVALNAIDRFAKSGLQHLVPISSDPKVNELPCSASAFATQIKRLIVLDDIPLPKGETPLNWTPFMMDKTKKNPIATWLTLPWGGPQLAVLPGFHTPAENSLKVDRKSTLPPPNGDDLFLSAMILEACGAKTVLLSRWRTGGRTSYDLTEQFLVNYQTNRTSEAWRKAVLTVGGEPIHLEEEPRIRSTENDEPPQANHPFFWGSFILIDRGEIPQQTE